MDDRSKSILLQVAFKAAVEMNDVTEATVVSNYELLTGLHDKLGINPTASSGRGSGGAKRSSTPPPQGETFIFNGVLVEDFRGVKSAPGSKVKPNYPDFKTATGQAIDGVTTDSGAAWLYDQDGSPNENVKPLVEAADQKVF